RRSARLYVGIPTVTWAATRSDTRPPRSIDPSTDTCWRPPPEVRPQRATLHQLLDALDPLEPRAHEILKRETDSIEERDELLGALSYPPARLERDGARDLLE